MRAQPATLPQFKIRTSTSIGLRPEFGDGVCSRWVALGGLLLGTLMVAWVFRNGYLVAYGDAASHLVMSRRILDSLTPGLAQIGTTWLPLPHLLVQPFIYVDWLYQTGLAASLVGIACYTLTCVFVYRTGYLATQSEVASLLGALVVGLNPNFLYLQATPLTEQVLLVAFAGAAYFLLRWARSFSMLDLVLSGGCACLASLARYDGWILVMAGFGLVAMVGLLGRRGRPFAEAHAVAFVAMAMNGPLLWSLYHLLIFNDPIYFIRNPFSAQSQQNALAAASSLPTKGNVVLSWSVYNWTVIDVIGPVLVALGALGLVLFAKAYWRRPMGLGALLLLAPYGFNVLALVIGQSTIAIPRFAPDGLEIHNARYGLMALPPVAVGVAYVAFALRRLWPLIALIVLLQPIELVTSHQMLVLDEGLHDSRGAKRELSDYLKQHYDGGLILMDPYLAQRGNAGAAVIWRTQLPLRNFVNDGNHPYWENALADPRNVRWIVIVPGDRLDEEFNGGEKLAQWFTPVFMDANGAIFQRRPEVEPPPASRPRAWAPPAAQEWDSPGLAT